jgi:glycosyltransferase involved in cell wall biosynthesis
MRFVNISKNTVALADIDKIFPYREDLSLQEISIDDARKSPAFRRYIQNGNFLLIECGNSLYERNLLRLNKTKIQDMTNKEKVNEVQEVSSATQDIEVKIKGGFYDSGGYSKKNRNLAIGLSKRGIKVDVEAIGLQNADLKDEDICKFKDNLTQVSNSAVAIDSIIPSFTFSSNGGKYRILNTTVESYTIPKQFLDSICGYNEIWVPSDFCKEILQKSGVKVPVYVIPDSIDTELYVPAGNKMTFNPPLKKFIFLSVFRWNYRKGYDALLRSYLAEFDGNEDVSLLIASRPLYSLKNDGAISSEIRNFVFKYGGSKPPHIVLCDKIIQEDQMPSLYRAANAFVLFSRGEAMGLPYLEAGAAGCPVIASNCSGHSMFLKKDNSTLVEMDELTQIQEGQMKIHFWDGQLFPNLTSSDFLLNAQKAMREVFTNELAAKKKNEILRENVLKNYSIGSVCDKAYTRLLEIHTKLNKKA